MCEREGSLSLVKARETGFISGFLQRLSNPDDRLSMTRLYTESLPASVHTSVALPAARSAWASVGASLYPAFPAH